MWSRTPLNVVWVIGSKCVLSTPWGAFTPALGGVDLRPHPPGRMIKCPGCHWCQQFNYCGLMKAKIIRFCLFINQFYLKMTLLENTVLSCDNIKYSAAFVAYPGGTGHLRTWAGVCQRITNSAELLSTTPTSQWQVRSITRRCDGSINDQNTSLKAESIVVSYDDLFG